MEYIYRQLWNDSVYCFIRVPDLETANKYKNTLEHPLYTFVNNL